MLPTAIPPKMIVEDFDRGYYVIEFKKVEQTPEKGKKVPLYEHKRYYHRLQDALEAIEEN